MSRTTRVVLQYKAGADATADRQPLRADSQRLGRQAQELQYIERKTENMQITDEEYEHLLDMAGATWHRNAVRWARHLVSHQSEAKVEVANQVVAENDGAWADLSEKERFTLVNRVVSRFHQRWARDHRRNLYADETVSSMRTGLRGGTTRWDLIDVPDEYTSDPEDILERTPLDRDGLVALFVEHGITYSPAEATVEKLLAWANAPEGASKAEVGRAMGLGDNTIAQAIYEIKRWGLSQEVTA